MKYSLDSVCGPPVVKRGPELKPKPLTGIQKHAAEQVKVYEFRKKG
jgi:hypothetical protein